jgi:hypothetical protein
MLYLNNVYQFGFLFSVYHRIFYLVLFFSQNFVWVYDRGTKYNLLTSEAGRTYSTQEWLRYWLDFWVIVGGFLTGATDLFLLDIFRTTSRAHSENRDAFPRNKATIAWSSLLMPTRFRGYAWEELCLVQRDKSILRKALVYARPPTWEPWRSVRPSLRRDSL